MNRRGKRKSVKSVEKCLIVGGVNPDGARGKWITIKKAVKESGASVWSMQETKCKIEGQLKLDGFITYEHLRSNREGGGLALSARKELNPVFISDGGEDVEALTVDIHIKQMTISYNTAYGPQENASIEGKNKFWEYLTEQAVEANKEGKGFILQGDLNAWLGPNIIPGDQREQNKNGKLFEAFLNTNKLTVVHSLSLCKGLVTRERNRNGMKIQSILDFYVVCQRVLPSVINMEIDNDRKYMLTNFKKVRKGGRAIDTDHMTTTLKLNLIVTPSKPSKIEIFNFKNKQGQETFKDSTTNTTDFSRCFMSNEPVDVQAEKWIKVLFTHCAKSFPKIRIKPHNIKPSAASKLINQRNNLVKKEGSESKNVQKLDITISEILAEEGRSKAYMFKKFCDKENTVKVGEMWKLKKKLWPKKKCALPVAKKNYLGKIVSAPSDLRKLLQKEYKNRLRSRPSHPDMKSHRRLRHQVIQMKLKLASQTQTKPFDMTDLEKVLHDLKLGKSRDPDGLARDIFKEQIIGYDLKYSLLTLCNNIKQQGIIPKFMLKTTISTIPKKGPRIELKNERGIFLVHTIRGIFMRLLFNSESDMIELKMSDSNIGGRKNKSCINHIWVLNSIIHEQLASKSNNPIIFQQYDYSQMFDSMSLKEACADLFDIGLKNNKLQVLYNANKQVKVKVNTPSGLTGETIMHEVVMQGDTWASTMASIQCDSFGKELLEENASYIFKYKGYIPVGILGQIDDLIGITEAGFKAQQMNAFLNVKSANKYLQFGPNKG